MRDYMENLTTNVRPNGQRGSLLFMIAGSFMLLNTVFLWARHFSNYQLSILWPAIPANNKASGAYCELTI